LSRVQMLLRLNKYIDEQAKSVVLSLARSIEAKDSLSEGHSDRMAEYAAELGKQEGLQNKNYKNCGSHACFTMWARWRCRTASL